MGDGIHQAEQHRSAVPGIEAISLVSQRAFPRHAHDHFGIGVMISGGHRSWSGVGPVEAVAGDVIMVNPGEIHDGVPLRDQARGWRMLYVGPNLMTGVVGDDIPGEAEIARPAVRDPRLGATIRRLFAEVTARQPDGFAIEQSLVQTLIQVLRRHGARPARVERYAPSVETALRRLDTAPQDRVSLEELAALSGVSRSQLLRGFARAVGITPHAYLIQRRVRMAQFWLAAGQSPADAAMSAGFADQSHMTRAFVRQFGITPGRYRAALA